MREFLTLVHSVGPDAWHLPMAPGKWSPAELTVHVMRSYEFGREATEGGTGMRLRVSPVMAWVLGHTLLPLCFITGRFPRGADAPREVRPDLALARTLSQAEAAARLAWAADEAKLALAAADGPGARRVVHAYFGALSPRQGLRLLSAHTRHHARGLAATLAGVKHDDSSQKEK